MWRCGLSRVFVFFSAGCATDRLCHRLRKTLTHLGSRIQRYVMWRCGLSRVFVFFSAGCAPDRLCHHLRKTLTHLPTYVLVMFESTVTLPHPIYKLQPRPQKTDPFHQGVTLFIGVTGATLCLVSAVLNYMVVRGSLPGPLFTWDDSQGKLWLGTGQPSLQQVTEGRTMWAIGSA